MLGAGNAKMTMMWSLTQESSCPVVESLRNRALQPKEMSLITEEHTMLGRQRGPGGLFRKGLEGSAGVLQAGNRERYSRKQEQHVYAVEERTLV